MWTRTTLQAGVEVCTDCLKRYSDVIRWLFSLERKTEQHFLPLSFVLTSGLKSHLFYVSPNPFITNQAFFYNKHRETRPRGWGLFFFFSALLPVLLPLLDANPQVVEMPMPLLLRFVPPLFLKQSPFCFLQQLKAVRGQKNVG